MNTTTPPAFRHEDFCLPRPGEDAPRIETYRVPIYDGGAGVYPTGSTEVCRCIECGAATYNGERRG